MNRLAGLAITLALTAAGALVTVTFTDGGAGALNAVELSGFAAGLFKAALAVGAFWAFDRFVLPGDACEQILDRQNVAYGLLLVALGLILAATMATAQPVAVDRAAWSVAAAGTSGRATDPSDVSRASAVRLGVVMAAPVLPHVAAAVGQVGVVERGGNNRGPEVARYLRSVGITTPAPWCAAFVRWSLDQAGADVRDARGQSIRSGVATAYLRGVGTVDARDVLRGTARPTDGALVVWRNGSGWTGHVGVVETDDNASGHGRAWYARCGVTIEGNTSSGRAGSQRDGGGVYRRLRCIEPGSYFRIVGFVPVVRSGSTAVVVSPLGALTDR